MHLQIVRKKASSLRELGRESLDIEPVSTLEELLQCVSLYYFQKQHSTHTLENLTLEEINSQANLGKVTFSVPYNENTESPDKAVKTMLQDFEDGLFRVFLNGQEYTCRKDAIQLQKTNELVFIRLVMLAGRLW